MTILLVIIAAIFTSQSVFADIADDIKLCLQQSQQADLEPLLLRALDQHVSLDELQQIAEECNNQSLIYAIKTTKKVKERIAFVSVRDFLQAALFIETRLQDYIEQEQYYLPKDTTGLSYALEYDPTTRAHFIILEGKEAELGSGKMKVVTKAIYYTHKNPKLVARAEQTSPMDKELEITKLTANFPGMFETLGFGSHYEGNTLHTTIYSKLYNPGSLEVMYESGQRLSLYEQVKVALNIVKGLEALHKAGIVHRDLGARNYLVHIPSGKKGRRDVVGCIADLGRADYIENVAHSKVQGNTTYTAPEGIFLDKMTGESYYKSDVFAVGCVFYRLIHGRKGMWQNPHHVKDTFIPAKERYKMKVQLLEIATKSRRDMLKRKANRSNEEEFEYVVLGMLEAHPEKRESARSARIKMERLFERL